MDSSQPRLASVAPGDHVGCLFASEIDRRVTAARFVREGLQRQERVVYLVDGTLPEVLHAYLRYDGVDVAAHVRMGQLRFFPAQAVYLDVRLDVSGVRSMDLGAARMLCRPAEELESRVVLLQAAVRRLLEILGLDDGVRVALEP